MDNLLELIWTLGKELKDEITIRSLSIKAKVPYTTANRLIKKNNQLFTIKQKGNIKLCSLNLTDSLTKNYLIIAERKKAENFLKKHKEFKIIKDDFLPGDYCVILFGSRAEERHREKSDIDVLIINKNGKKNINFSKHERLFKLEINPIFMSKKEFTAMLKEKEHNLANEVIKSHIILYGEEYFWNILWHNKTNMFLSI
ncbi:MAG: nucleotidyltransferase domain-containing protein [Nanoarchaeota archaeon]|nr:nucleotidyltransferase domain-containing protein [Nanoarchaeota archaeon]